MEVSWGVTTSQRLTSLLTSSMKQHPSSKPSSLEQICVEPLFKALHSLMEGQHMPSKWHILMNGMK